MVKTDITYSSDSLFTTFYAETRYGEDALRQMHEQHGSFKVLNMEAARVIQQLRAAQYSVAKIRKSNDTIESILAELEA